MLARHRIKVFSFFMVTGKHRAFRGIRQISSSVFPTWLNTQFIDGEKGSPCLMLSKITYKHLLVFPHSKLCGKRFLILSTSVSHLMGAKLWGLQTNKNRLRWATF